jgi:hypothetical protein
MGQLEKRKDSELSTIMSYMTPEIVKTLKLRRTRWPGYLDKANETSRCRKVTFSKPEGTREGWKTQPEVCG